MFAIIYPSKLKLKIMWRLYKYFALLVCVFAYPKSDAEYKVQITKHIMKCAKKHPVEMSELFNLEKHIVPKNKDTKCLLACAYKLDGGMTKDGMYDVAQSYKVTESIAGGDEKKKKNGIILSDTCGKVNSVPVSDGEKGCERAALIFKCLVENGPKLGFNA